MKIGFRTAGFREKPLQRALRVLAELGFDGLELCLENHGLRPDLISEEDLASLPRLIVDSGLELASVSYHGDGAPLPVRLPNTLKAIEMTKLLDCSILILNTERPEPTRRDKQWQDLTEHMRMLTDVADEHDVTLALEPEPGLLIDGMSDFARLKEAVGSDRLALNLDIGHCHITDDVPAAIETFAESLVHTHFEDIAGKVHNHLVPGEGNMDLPEVIRCLHAVGYEGYLTVDLFRITDAPADYARRALDAMRSLLDL